MEMIQNIQRNQDIEDNKENLISQEEASKNFEEINKAKIQHLQETNISEDQKLNQVIQIDKLNDLQNAFQNVPNIMAKTIQIEQDINKIMDYLPAENTIQASKKIKEKGTMDEQLQNIIERKAARKQLEDFVIESQKHFIAYRLRIIDVFVCFDQLRNLMRAITNAIVDQNYSDEVINGFIKNKGHLIYQTLKKVENYRDQFQNMFVGSGSNQSGESKDNEIVANQQEDKLVKALNTLMENFGGTQDTENRIKKYDQALAEQEKETKKYAQLQKKYETILAKNNSNIKCRRDINEFDIRSYQVLIDKFISDYFKLDNLIKKKEDDIQASNGRLDQQKKDLDDAFEIELETLKKNFEANRAQGKQALQDRIEIQQQEIESLQKEIDKAQEAYQSANSQVQKFQNNKESWTKQQLSNYEKSVISVMLDQAKQLDRNAIEMESKKVPTIKKNNVYKGIFGILRKFDYDVPDIETKKLNDTQATNLRQLANDKTQQAAKALDKEKSRIQTEFQQNKEDLDKHAESLMNKVEKLQLRKQGIENQKNANQNQLNDFDSQKQFDPVTSTTQIQKFNSNQLDKFQKENQSRLNQIEEDYIRNAYDICSGCIQGLNQINKNLDQKDIEIDSKGKKEEVVKMVKERILATVEIKNFSQQDFENISSETREKIYSRTNYYKFLIKDKTNIDSDKSQFETKNDQLKRDVQEQEQKMKKAEQKALEASKQIEQVEEKIPMDIKNLIKVTSIISQTRCKDGLASILSQSLPSMCQMLIQNLELALIDICPKDGSNPIIPRLLSKEEIEKEAERLIMDINSEYVEKDDNNETKLIKFFKKTMPKTENQKMNDLINQFIKEELIWSNFQELLEDSMKEKKDQVLFAGQYYKLAVPFRTMALKEYDEKIEQKKDRLAYKLRESQTKAVFNPAVALIQIIPQPLLIQKKLIDTANQIANKMGAKFDEKEMKDLNNYQIDYQE